MIWALVMGCAVAPAQENVEPADTLAAEVIDVDGEVVPGEWQDDHEAATEPPVVLRGVIVECQPPPGYGVPFYERLADEAAACASFVLALSLGWRKIRPQLQQLSSVVEDTAVSDADALRTALETASRDRRVASAEAEAARRELAAVRAQLASMEAARTAPASGDEYERICALGRDALT